jgi:hypothetical protein
VQHFQRRGDRHRLLEGGVHRQAVAKEDRHPDGGGVDRELGRAEQARRLLREAALLARYAVLVQLVDLRDHVEGDLTAERLAARRPAAQHGHGLPGELIHRCAAAARDRLVGRDVDAGEARECMQRRERGRERDARAAGERYEPVRAEACEHARIDVRRHERHVRLCAERGGVVDHPGVCRGRGGIARGKRRPSAEEREIYRFEIESRDCLGLEVRTLAFPRRVARCAADVALIVERVQLCDRECPRAQLQDDRLADETRCADDRNAQRPCAAAHGRSRVISRASCARRPRIAHGI